MKQKENEGESRMKKKFKIFNKKFSLLYNFVVEVCLFRIMKKHSKFGIPIIFA